MNPRVKILLLGLMILVLRIISGGFFFAVETGFFVPTSFIIAVETFFTTIGLVIALLQVFKEKGQDYKRIGLEAGITWYLILVLLDLIFTLAFQAPIISWYRSIFSNFHVLIIPILIGRISAKQG